MHRTGIGSQIPDWSDALRRTTSQLPHLLDPHVTRCALPAGDASTKIPALVGVAVGHVQHLTYGRLAILVVLVAVPGRERLQVDGWSDFCDKFLAGDHGRPQGSRDQ